MAKLLREDYRRPKDWASIPDDLCPLYSDHESSGVVCSECKRPTGGLRFDPATGTFIHSDKNCCTPALASQR